MMKINSSNYNNNNNNSNKNNSFSADFVRFRRVRPTGDLVTDGFSQLEGAIPAEVPPTKRDSEKEQNGGGKGIRQLMSFESTKCMCHGKDYPSWTGEVHGLSQALYSKSLMIKVFWRIVLALCTLCGAITTSLVIKEYLDGKTATSNTVRLVTHLKLPAITVCPKVPDVLDTSIYKDMEAVIPQLKNETAVNLIKYWIGGSGLENMNDLSEFNDTYMEKLDELYKRWAQKSGTKTFFYKIQDKYGYKCTDLFKKCELGGREKNCCNEIFTRKAVMRRGLCYQTRRGLNQTEADDIGRLVLEIKQLPSITSRQFDYKQPQTVIYINDNFEEVLDFPRFYLYPNEWNRMHITARRIELLEHPNDCTDRIFGKDSKCIVHNWLSATVIDPLNCTLPYLDTVIWPRVPTCEPLKVVRNYTEIIQRVHSGSVHSPKCIPGCKRWDYSVSLQQSPSLQNFTNYTFNLEVSFYDLQYEHLKEVATITLPGFMSQIGGQFGFFLGLSIITVIQIINFGIWYIFRLALTKTHFLGNRRKFDRIFALFGISIEEAAKDAGVRHRNNGGESTETENGGKRTPNREMKVVTRRRSKSEEDEEIIQKRRVKLTKQKSFDDGEIAKC